MADIVYVNDVTIYGVPGVLAVPGIAILDDLQAMSVTDRFKLAEQIDTAGDVVRVTPWNHQRDIRFTIHPVVDDTSLLALPVPMSVFSVSARPGAPSGKAMPGLFYGNWWYIGGGTVETTNTGLMVWKLPARKYNPLYV